MELLALIPARGGSKGIPRKNLRPIGGVPMVARAWRAARSARPVSRIVVSTDDLDVAEMAKREGIEVPFLRPAALASDEATAVDAAVHALEWLDGEQGYRPEVVLWLQPTSPFRTAADIEAAFALFQAKSAAAVVSVCAVKMHPIWMRTIDDEGRLWPLLGASEEPARRQDLPPAYRPNGAIYLVDRRVLLQARTFQPASTFAYVMPEERSLDIDTPWDLRLAEAMVEDASRS